MGMVVEEVGWSSAVREVGAGLARLPRSAMVRPLTRPDAPIAYMRV